MGRNILLIAHIILVFALLANFASAAQNSCSSESQAVLSLFSKTNSHSALFSESSYSTKICYDEIFGLNYSLSNSRSCSGSNLVLRLSGSTNAHAESPLGSLYPIEVCFGDLRCELKTGSCGVNQSFVLSMSETSNAHLASGPDYPYLLCCSSHFALSQNENNESNNETGGGGNGGGNETGGGGNGGGNETGGGGNGGGNETGGGGNGGGNETGGGGNGGGNETGGGGNGGGNETGGGGNGGGNETGNTDSAEEEGSGGSSRKKSKTALEQIILNPINNGFQGELENSSLIVLNQKKDKKLISGINLALFLLILLILFAIVILSLLSRNRR